MPTSEGLRYIGVVYVIPATVRKQANVSVVSQRYKGLGIRNVKNVNCVVSELNSSPN